MSGAEEARRGERTGDNAGGVQVELRVRPMRHWTYLIASKNGSNHGAQGEYEIDGYKPTDIIHGDGSV